MTGTTTAPRPAPLRRRGPSWGPLVTGGALLVVGVLWLAGAAGWYAVPWESAVAGVLLVVGAALLVLARAPGAGGLVGLGVVLAVVLVLQWAVGGATWRGGTGDTTVRPQRVEDVRDQYRLGAGDLVVDLRDVRLPAGRRVVHADLGLGDLTVRVPRDAAVHVRADAGAGQLDVLGRTRDGLSPALEVDRAGDGPSLLDLDLSVGLGSVEVTR